MLGSKLSLHFSWLSDFSSFPSYLIPTVFTRWSVNDVAVRDAPSLVCNKSNPFRYFQPTMQWLKILGGKYCWLCLFFTRNPQQQVSSGFPVCFPKIRQSGTFLSSSSTWNWIFSERNSRFWISVPAVLSLFLCLCGSTWLTGDDSDSLRPDRSVIRYRIITNAGTTRGQNIWGGLGGLGSGGAAVLYYCSFPSIRATHLGCQWTCYDTLSSASPVHSMYVQELFF